MGTGVKREIALRRGTGKGGREEEEERVEGKSDGEDLTFGTCWRQREKENAQIKGTEKNG